MDRGSLIMVSSSSQPHGVVLAQQKGEKAVVDRH